MQIRPMLLYLQLNCHKGILHKLWYLIYVVVFNVWVKRKNVERTLVACFEPYVYAHCTLQNICIQFKSSPRKTPYSLFLILPFTHSPFLTCVSYFRMLFTGSLWFIFYKNININHFHVAILSGHPTHLHNDFNQWRPGIRTHVP